MYRSLVACLLSLTPELLAGESALRYRVRLEPRDGEPVVESEVRLVPVAPLRTRNRVQQPRLGRWRLEVVKTPDGRHASRLLAQVAPFFYLSTPSPGMIPTGERARKGGRGGRIWRAGEGEALVHLLEVQPRLLVLQRYQGPALDPGLRTVRLELEAVEGGGAFWPAEGGMALQQSLRRLQVSDTGLSSEALVPDP